MTDLSQFPGSAADLPGKDNLLDVRPEGRLLCLYTAEHSVRRSQLYVRAVGVIAVAVGFGLLRFTPFGLLVSGLGVLVFFLVPRYFRPVKLIAIDQDSNRLVVVQTAGEDNFLPIEQIRCIRGAYDTKGWNGYSVLNAQMDDESETAVLVLDGTDERLAEQTCRILGLLLDRPATYAGPFGTLKTCFSPAGPRPKEFSA